MAQQSHILYVAQDHLRDCTELAVRRGLAKSRRTMSLYEAILQWFEVKERLHEAQHRPPLVSEGDIWWASVGENVGSEINGKSGLFSRPVVIYKKLSHGFYFVVPTTTQERSGTWFVAFRQQDKMMVACLNQAR
jgi:mRNA interferase MazF